MGSNRKIVLTLSKGEIIHNDNKKSSQDDQNLKLHNTLEDGQTNSDKNEEDFFEVNELVNIDSGSVNLQTDGQNDKLFRPISNKIYESKRASMQSHLDDFVERLKKMQLRGNISSNEQVSIMASKINEYAQGVDPFLKNLPSPPPAPFRPSNRSLNSHAGAADPAVTQMSHSEVLKINNSF